MQQTSHTEKRIDPPGELSRMIGGPPVAEYSYILQGPDGAQINSSEQNPLGRA